MLGGVACVSCHVMCHVIMRVGVCMRTRVYARMHMRVRVHVCVHGIRGCMRVRVCAYRMGKSVMLGGVAGASCHVIC